jgi:hypothetical protein
MLAKAMILMRCCRLRLNEQEIFYDKFNFPATDDQQVFSRIVFYEAFSFPVMRTSSFSDSWKIDFRKIEESFHQGTSERIKSEENEEILCLAVY